MIGVTFLFGMVIGALLGVQAGLVLSVVFERWSKTAGEWIMRKWFGGRS